MTTKRVPSIDRVKARGQRLSEGMPDEIDAVAALKLNSTSSTLRQAADGRYRTILTDVAPGCTDITVGTGVDDSGEEPVSVTDEAVAGLVMSGASATRAALNSLYSDDDVLGDADVASLVTSGGSATRAALVSLISDQTGDVAGDEDVAGLVTADGTATRAALDARYGLPAELKSGAMPTFTAHSDAGDGAAIVAGGTRRTFRVTITTGANPVQGGCLAVFALQGYALPPVALFEPCDEITAMLRHWKLASNTELRLMVASEVNAFTAYTFDVLVEGL